MPARNTIKTYVENGYYHLYNRGVEKRRIFLDAQDYSVFLFYLSQYLLPKDENSLQQKLVDPATSYKEKGSIVKLLRLNNFAGEIDLLAYCLMPNHFHLFVKQKGERMIDAFMQSLCTRYSLYINRKYKRVGSLFQAVYKALLVTAEEQFIYLSAYIHRQALASKGKNQPCSFPEYLGKRQTPWLKPQEVLSYFSKSVPNLSYESFTKQKELPFESFSIEE